MNVDTLTDLDPRDMTGTYLGLEHRHTDADSIRRAYGIPAYDRGAFDFPIIPNCLEHSWQRTGDISSGGTDFLTVGKPDAGKSTLAKYIGARLMEINNEIVVWRGSESRSEWVAFAPWTRLCLPAGVDVSATVRSKRPGTPAREVDLTDIVREVVRYESPRDLNENHLTPGMFHVVYPDPEMKGCQAVYEASPKTYELEFSPDDPPVHWWFAWILDRVENGPYHWTTLLFDEIGDLAPQDAEKDAYSSYQKVELLKDTYVDARKFGLSIGGFGHSEPDIHDKIRRKMRWRITLNGISNPTSAGKVVGMDSVPMRRDLTSRMNVGRGLIWNETTFDVFAWSDVPAPTDEILKISFSGGRPDRNVGQGVKA